MLRSIHKPILWFSTLIFLALFTFSVVPTHANGTEDCRIGVVGGLDNIGDERIARNKWIETNQWIETLDASWYVNYFPYRTRRKLEGSGQLVAVDARYIPMIHVKQDKHLVTGERLDSYTMEWRNSRTLTQHALTGLVRFDLGALWIIGNEPDREESQDDMMPEVYARAYHEIREFILSIDSTAQFANAGLVQVTPNRIQYLDTVMETYQTLYGEPMPVDVWNIHVYPVEELTASGEVSGIGGIALGSSTIDGMSAPPGGDGVTYCNSGDPESPYYNNNPSFVTDNITCLAEHDDVRVFRYQVEMMRQWMKDNGQQDKPLIITEMGILWPYTEVNNTDPETCGFLQDEFGQCFSPRRVGRFMSDVNDYLLTASDPNLGYSKGSEHKLVQQWAWFSVYQSNLERITQGGENGVLASSSNLIADPWGYSVLGDQSALTEIGQIFQSYARTPGSELTPNLYIDGAPDGYIVGQTENGWNQVTFSVPLRNDGNTSTDANTYVLIYGDSSLGDLSLIGYAEASPSINGCATDVGYATTTLSVPPSVTEFYVAVQDGQSENDAYTADNIYADEQGVPIAIAIGDSFEVDDGWCGDASLIETDGTVQTHTFHDAGDVDWVRFDVVEGKTYRVVSDAILEGRADVTMDVYGECESEVIFEQNPSFSRGTEMQFEAPSSGVYYMRFHNKDESVFGDDVVYTVSVQEESQDQIGAVILVGGRSHPNDREQPNIEHAVNKVYDLYRSTQQYPDDHIHFLSTAYVPEEAYDSDVHEVDGIARTRDGMPTLERLEEAITSWALDYVSAEHPLTIYMISHGNSDDHFFYLDGEEEILHPETFNEWLNTLEAEIPGLKINFILEMCHAGSFIEANRPESPDSQRLMIASATSPQLAFASREGAYFSDYFFQAIGLSRNVELAFRQANREVRDITRYFLPQMQTPILDANGNRIWNESEDFALARQRGFGHAGTLSSGSSIFYEPQFWPPLIETAEAVALQESGNNHEIVVTAVDDQAITTVWADVYAPSVQAAQAEASTQNEGELAVFSGEKLLLTLQEDGSYRSTHCFDEIGSYHAIVYVEDEDGLISRPETLTFDITEICSSTPLAVGMIVSSTTSIFLLSTLVAILFGLFTIMIVNTRRGS